MSEEKLPSLALGLRTFQAARAADNAHLAEPAT
jgi:hypothetical protein